MADNSQSSSAPKRPLTPIYLSGRVELRLFALIVVIDQYKHDELLSLDGCKNDGKNVYDYLTNTLQVPESNIRLIADDGATREAILSEFKNHLILNNEIRKGDCMLFFYSGHGTRIQAPTEWFAVNDLVEAICPYDEGTLDSNGNVIYAIPDCTFDGLMRELASQKGDNIVAIFDSCHSGGITRGPRKIRYRPTPSYNLPEHLDHDIRMWGGLIPARAANTALPKGFLYEALSSHVLLSACREEEAAAEDLDAVQRPCGAFTNSLFQKLRDCNIREVTYACLLDIMPPLQNQRPQCEGRNKNRRLFGLSVQEKSEKMFKVVKREGKCQVEAGSIQGVVIGTEFSVGGVTLVATEVEGSSCIVKPKPDDKSFEVPSGAKAEVIRWNAPRLRVHYYPGSGTMCHTVGPNEPADVAIFHGSEDTLMLERKDPIVPRYATPIIEIKKERIEDILDGVAHFNFHLFRRNESKPLKQEVTVKLHRLQKKEDIPQAVQIARPPVYIPTGDDLFTTTTSTESTTDDLKEAVIHDMDAYYGLTVENHSDVDLFPYVFYFDPAEYSVQAWYLPPATAMFPPLPRKRDNGRPSMLPVGYGTSGTDMIEFSLPPGVTSESGFLKVFVSGTYVSMGVLRLPSPINNPRRQTRLLPLPFEEGWDSWTSVLTCRSAPPS